MYRRSPVFLIFCFSSKVGSHLRTWVPTGCPLATGGSLALGARSTCVPTVLTPKLASPPFGLFPCPPGPFGCGPGTSGRSGLTLTWSASSLACLLASPPPSAGSPSSMDGRSPLMDLKATGGMSGKADLRRRKLIEPPFPWRRLLCRCLADGTACLKWALSPIPFMILLKSALRPAADALVSTFFFVAGVAAAGGSWRRVEPPRVPLLSQLEGELLRLGPVCVATPSHRDKGRERLGRSEVGSPLRQIASPRRHDGVRRHVLVGFRGRRALDCGASVVRPQETCWVASSPSGTSKQSMMIQSRFRKVNFARLDFVRYECHQQLSASHERTALDHRRSGRNRRGKRRPSALARRAK